MSINNNTVTLPASSYDVIESNPITASANDQSINGINYSFVNWNTGSTNRSVTFLPESNSTFIANFIGKPSNIGEAVRFGNVIGQPIEVFWNNNNNINVTQYQIWRKIDNGSPQLIGTVPRNTIPLKYIDTDCLLAVWKQYSKLEYDVRAYYSIENTYSDPTWSVVYGEVFKKDEDNYSKINVPTEFSISNYPNPFNPETNINYELPKSGNVIIKVFDILGKEVAELVNESKGIGYYNVKFNGSELPSGIYIYSIQAGKVQLSKKMLLIK